MPEKINREMYALNVQSRVDNPRDGVLATIGGKFSTSAVPSRNDRTYTPDLWRSVVSSDRVQEMLETKTFYGELSHPPRSAEFLSEVQMANLSHNITKLNFDEKSQDLLGTIDILDTPSGRIADTLLKYGSKLGISSRGIVMDDSKYNANPNEMNPDNYYLVTFDLVALPGIMGARLDSVTESMAPRRKSKLILESLSELHKSIKKAKDTNDEQSLAVLETIERSIKSDEEMKKDPMIQKAIKELSKREEDEEVETNKPINPEAPVDREDVSAVVLEKKNESDGYLTKKNTVGELSDVGTYDLDSGSLVEFQTGYQVSFERPDDKYTPERYEKIIKTIMEKTGAKPYLGFFDGNKEVSFHIDDLGKAIKVAKKFKQDSVWDWAAEKLIESADFDSALAGAKDKPAVAEVLEDDSGATQAADIAGPASTVNMIGDPMKPDEDKIKTFLESFDGIQTLDDVVKYVESMDGVEKAADGKVIINKDTMLFNTMLSMINTIRLRSDANPLMAQGTSIKNVKDLEQGTEPDNKEYDQDEKKPETIKKAIEVPEDADHKSALESVLVTISSMSAKADQLHSRLYEVQLANATLEHKNTMLKAKLNANYRASTEAIAQRDNRIKELADKVREADKTKKRAATEAVSVQDSYRVLESSHTSLKSNYKALEADFNALRDKLDIASGRTAETRKDNRVRKLIEAQSFTVQNIEDDTIRTANEAESVYDGYVTGVSEAEQMARVVQRVVPKRK